MLHLPSCRRLQACSSNSKYHNIVDHLETLIMYLRTRDYSAREVHHTAAKTTNLFLKNKHTKAEVPLMTASIWLRCFRSNTSTHHSDWQTLSQKAHSQEADGHNWHCCEHHDAHCIYSKRFVSFFCGFEFSENFSLHRKARNKS